MTEYRCFVRYPDPTVNSRCMLAPGHAGLHRGWLHVGTGAEIVSWPTPHEEEPRGAA